MPALVLDSSFVDIPQTLVVQELEFELHLLWYPVPIGHLQLMSSISLLCTLFGGVQEVLSFVLTDNTKQLLGVFFKYSLISDSI